LTNDHARLTVTQNPTFNKIQDGGGCLLDCGFLAISVVNEDICFTFGALIDIDHIWVTVTSNHTFIKIQDGGGRHLRFWTFGHISVVNKVICFKYGTLIDVDHNCGTVTHNPTFWEN